VTAAQAPEAVTLKGLAAACVAALWGIASTQLILWGWLATADFFIALVALARGRMTGARAFEAALAAVLSSAMYGVLLRLGFWLLVEVLAFGSTRWEQAVYLASVVLAAGVGLPRLPSRLRKAWGAAMSPVAGAEGSPPETRGTSPT
jgi:hypothetical protein